ncbi:hypothetical protein AGABI2DRAFT_192996 [Agaricus bisporus var. bisporus H97]|uniref:hypothetical protein n=1 Tax=Agaricus bisporus var. bisporus (strain H97 / ATCC MYA-4626 / FGSC 10389) TaxID=936046 RepID=UPI00029F5D9E|nr:hypothetical protein AGABI2DRAFT_192996 [Agaricus bisporus var. bisporus H97]EKV46204.1 hypothetical protein AGABI2DRAFT_192996 [Agaricus bisporus var. bisporus H97]
MVCGEVISELQAARTTTEDINYTYPFLEIYPYMKISDTTEEITRSIGNSIVLRPGFGWSDAGFSRVCQT